jgi:hypothetical protein
MHRTTKIYQSPTHAVIRREIILQNLRFNNKIRKRVRTIYKSADILPNNLLHLMIAR